MRSRWPILAIFVLSGAAGLIYEIVWSRQLVLVFGNTTQAVSAILAGFFGGMAIGSALGGRLADRVRSPLRLYGIIELVLVVVVIATPLTFRIIRDALWRDLPWRSRMPRSSSRSSASAWPSLRSLRRRSSWAPRCRP